MFGRPATGRRAGHEFLKVSLQLCVSVAVATSRLCRRWSDLLLTGVGRRMISNDGRRVQPFGRPSGQWSGAPPAEIVMRNSAAGRGRSCCRMTTLGTFQPGQSMRCRTPSELPEPPRALDVALVIAMARKYISQRRAIGAANDHGNPSPDTRHIRWPRPHWELFSFSLLGGSAKNDVHNR